MLIAATLTDCSSYSSWTEVQEDAPWGDDRNRVTSWRRTETPSSLMVVGASLSEESWMVNGKHVRTLDVASSITGYLKRIGYIEKQRTINAYSNGIQERVAEHRFFIVSLQPTVVIMTPYTVGPIEGKSSYELRGSLSEQTLSSFPLINRFHYGTRVARSSQYHWFSPDLRSAIQPVSRDGAQWIIDDESVRIVLSPSPSRDWMRVARQH